MTGIPPVAVGPLAPADLTAVRAFFDGMPEGDRTFFREDVLAPGTLERWTTETASRRYVARLDGAIAGYAAVIPGVAWSAHVGEIRLVVGPHVRRRGVGRALARQVVVGAVELGVTKLVVEVVATEEATVAMFVGMGFEPEGLLRGHVRSRAGEVHDLLVLLHFVEDLWSTLRTTGIADVALDEPG